ncbi:hypothetical protein VNO77_10761 [Canavalia gladiata]|uniref:Flotillin-like n=1 Tax=Canavalia gladiata TaxID=3824 RepID=A0AAN9QY00_CANGL
MGFEGLREYEQIGKINGDAVRGLQPKISIWTNGNNCEPNDGNGMKEIAGVCKMLPPLFKTLHVQTGMLPPAWIGTLPDKTS